MSKIAHRKIMKTQELSVGDRVFNRRNNKTGTVQIVTRYPMTINETYWIHVKWDGNGNELDLVLESEVALMRSLRD